MKKVAFSHFSTNLHKETNYLHLGLYLLIIWQKIIIFVCYNECVMRKKLVSIQSIRQANRALINSGKTDMDKSSSSGSITIHIQRGTLNHKREISASEIREAYKQAIETHD